MQLHWTFAKFGGGAERNSQKLRIYRNNRKKILEHPHLNPKPAKNHPKDTNLDIFNKRKRKWIHLSDDEGEVMVREDGDEKLMIKTEKRRRNGDEEKRQLLDLHKPYQYGTMEDYRSCETKRTLTSSNMSGTLKR